MRELLKSSRGCLVAAALRKCWVSAPHLQNPLSAAQFDEVTPLLYDSGAAGLGWWRIRETDLRQTASGEMLHQAYRLLALQAAIHEEKIRKVFREMRRAGVEPILIKGWAAARMYPQTALRPYGDIDLLVRAQDFATALQVAENQLRDCRLDLHGPPFELADRSMAEVFGRSRLVSCGDEELRVPAHEDHFPLLSIHLLKHGAWRPLWLCDLAVLLESTSSDFDWDLCLGRDQRRANWILSVAGLAQVLLEASINDERIGARARQVPFWLQQHVLTQWETPFAHLQPPFRHHAPISFYLRRPRGLLPDLARRWPGPIIATISVNGTFGRRRRVRYEFGNWLLRTSRLLTRSYPGRTAAPNT